MLTVEADSCYVAYGTEHLSFIAAMDSVGVVFDHQQAVPPCNRHDRVHLASNPTIVDAADRPGPGCDRRFDLGLIDVLGVSPDIDEHGSEHDVGTDKHSVLAQMPWVSGPKAYIAAMVRQHGSGWRQPW